MSESTAGLYFSGTSKALLHEGHVNSLPVKSSGIVTGFMHLGQINLITSKTRKGT